MKISPLLFTFGALVTAYNDVPYFMGITTRPEDLPDRIVCPKEFDHNTHTWKFLPYQWFDVLDALNEPKNVQRMGGDLVKLWLYREFDSYAMFSVKLGRTNGHHTAKFLYATGPIIQNKLRTEQNFCWSCNVEVEHGREVMKTCAWVTNHGVQDWDERFDGAGPGESS